MSAADWNPGLYQSSHSFVWERGREMLAMLAPQPGERILDAGCGTGQLTAEIAAAGADVLGVDSSPAMVEQARRNFPEIPFELQDLRALPYRAEFDAVFSNAALHWVQPAEDAAASIARALKPGGRFVAEFGGRGNVQTIIEAAWNALEQMGLSSGRVNPWFFPSIGEYTALLERHGLEVVWAAVFDRPTPLEGGAEGLARWCAMFGAPLSEAVPEARREEYLKLVEGFAVPSLLREGEWVADYRRIRVMARATWGGRQPAA